jgi:hypothetical protein
MVRKKLHQHAAIDTRLRIPLHYQRQPLISRLVSRYGIKVNINAAMLSAKENYGWFDLQLVGNSQQIDDGLLYLQNLGVDLMHINIIDGVPDDLSSRSSSRPSQQFSHLPTASSQSYRLGLQVSISQDYSQTPIIFDLVSRYGITVNIIGAALLGNQQEDGWFDLDLWGTPPQLFSSCDYLENLNLPLYLNASSLDGLLL